MKSHVCRQSVFLYSGLLGELDIPASIPFAIDLSLQELENQSDRSNNWTHLPLSWPTLVKATRKAWSLGWGKNVLLLERELYRSKQSCSKSVGQVVIVPKGSCASDGYLARY